MTVKKLSLHKETLHLLNETEQPKIVAGAAPIPTKYYDPAECENGITKLCGGGLSVLVVC